MQNKNPVLSVACSFLLAATPKLLNFWQERHFLLTGFNRPVKD